MVVYVVLLGCTIYGSADVGIRKLFPRELINKTLDLFLRQFRIRNIALQLWGTDQMR